MGSRGGWADRPQRGGIGITSDIQGSMIGLCREPFLHVVSNDHCGHDAARQCFEFLELRRLRDADLAERNASLNKKRARFVACGAAVGRRVKFDRRIFPGGLQRKRLLFTQCDA